MTSQASTTTLSPATSDARDPRLKKMQEYAKIMQEFEPIVQSNGDARELVNLARIAFKQQGSLLAAERKQLNQSELDALNLDAGPVAASAVGGMQGLSSIVGGSAGATQGAVLGTMVLPGIGTAIGTVLGGLVGGTAGYATVRPALERSGVDPQVLDQTLQKNWWWQFGGNVAGGVGPSASRFVGIKMSTAATRLATAKAERTIAEANAAVADRVAKATAARTEAGAKRAALEIAEMERRMASPEKTASSLAKHKEIQARSREAISRAETAHWESVMAQQRASGQLSPLETARIEALGKQIMQADLRAQIMQQNLAAGLLKPAQAQATLTRLQTQVRVLENVATKSGAQAGIAVEESAIKLAMLKNQLVLLQAKMAEMGLNPIVAQTSSLAAKVAALQPPRTPAPGAP